MKRTINEIQGMVLRAARGAGVALGIAEDLSDCVPYAIANSALSDIADILGRDDHARLVGDIAIVDVHICGTPKAGPTHMPHRLFEALCAARGMETRLEPAFGPQTVSETDWAQLATLAALTHVPATEASRTSGAGAGLSDND